MHKFSAAIVVAAGLFAPMNAIADDLPDLKNISALEIAEMGVRVKIANGLIAMGRKDGDAQYIAVGARILAELKADVVDPESTKGGGKAARYDVKALMAGLEKLKGGKAAAMSVPLAADYTKPGQQSVCFWNYYCDLFFCGEYYDCGQGPPT